MNWTDVFPVLDDAMVDEYEAKASRKERKELADWFAVQEVINPRAVGHIVSVSLFWKNIRSHQPDIVIKNRAMFMGIGRRKKLLRFDPWQHYAEPLIKGALWVQANRPDVAFRVYLAADLEFLIPDLVIAGCEVHLMKSSSIRHNPGAMWRFLAFEETDKLVTLVDADRAAHPLADIVRTETTAKAGLGFWRVPVWGELNDEGNLNYRPIVGCQMGSAKPFPARLLMEALVWQTRRGGITKLAKPPGALPVTIHGTVWPDYGFDEWFLQVALYPRAAFEGLLTFVPSSAKSQLLPLDIEYAMWANAESEIKYFGWADGGCCAPQARGDVPKLKRSALRKSNGQVLLTGMWKVETPGDVVLINELCRYAASLDVPVLIRPALHVKSRSLLTALPEEVVADAMIWEGRFSTYIQGAFVKIISLQSDADWIWQADSDERVDFASAGGLKKVLRQADREGVDFIPGDWIDRIPAGDDLPELSERQPLAGQFPRAAKAVENLGQAWQSKIALNRRECLTIAGNHVPELPGKKASGQSIAIWHFKWHAECLPNQVVKLEGDPEWSWSWSWSWEMASLVKKLGKHGGTKVPWSEMPAKAWIKIKPEWKRGAYPCGGGRGREGGFSALEEERVKARQRGLAIPGTKRGSAASSLILPDLIEQSAPPREGYGPARIQEGNQELTRATLVVARYREDLSWLHELDQQLRVVVYNKGPELKSSALRQRVDKWITLPNLGRESDTYLAHLQKGRTSGDGDWTVFTQGDPFLHSPDFLQLLASRGDHWNAVQPLTMCFDTKYDAPPQLICDLEVAEWQGGARVRTELLCLQTLGILGRYNIGKAGEEYAARYRLPPGWNVAGHFLEQCGMLALAEQAWKSYVGQSVYGAIFAVREQQLDAIPKKCLPAMRRLACGDPVHGFVFERLWLHLFGLPFHLTEADKVRGLRRTMQPA